MSDKNALQLQGIFEDRSSDDVNSSSDEDVSDVSLRSPSPMSFEESDSGDLEDYFQKCKAPLGRQDQPGPAQPPAPPVQPAPAQQPAQSTAPDGTIWSSQPSPAVKKAPPNILTQQKGPKNLGGASTHLGLFELFFPAAMLQVILDYTNVEGLARRGRRWINVTMMELRSTIGLLLYLGLTKSGHERVRSFWHPGMFARPMCQATMSGKRFEEILTMLRFDDKTNRPQRKATDKFAAIREVFEMFATTLRQYYSCGECVTIDEQLVAFRGMCSFRQYMPAKPAKYGLKFWASVDSETHYVHNMKPYVSKQGDQRERELGARVVKDLVAPLYGTGRNVTADIFFVSMDLGQHLLNNKITLVGTVKNNRQEVPHDMRKENVKGRQPGSSRFMFSGMATLVSFVPRKNKNVLLMSTMHHDTATDPTSNKPDIITYYNSTKAGVDTVDQLCSLYNCARITSRWPLVVFYHILNCAVINAHVLYQQIHPQLHGEEKTRHDFTRQLVNALTEPQIQIRMANPSRLTKYVTRAFERIGYKFQHPHQQRPRVAKPPQRRCALCFVGNRRQTKRVCDECHRFACQLHSIDVTPQPVITCNECLMIE